MKKILIILLGIVVLAVIVTILYIRKAENIEMQPIGMAEEISTTQKQIVFTSLEDQQATLSLLEEAMQKGWTGTIKNYSGALTDATLFKALYTEIEKNIPASEKIVMIKKLEEITVLEDVVVSEVLGASEKNQIKVTKEVLKDYKTKGEIINVVKNAKLQDI